VAAKRSTPINLKAACILPSVKPFLPDPALLAWGRAATK
jgi:hypothetical protein